jgi:hypothetical protein
MEEVKLGKKVYRIPNGIANFRWGFSEAGWPKKSSCQVSRFFIFITYAPNYGLLNKGWV